ncbi:hypothetical protein ISCGN_016116 [Ixodes scapularis]
MKHSRIFLLQIILLSIASSDGAHMLDEPQDAAKFIVLEPTTGKQWFLGPILVDFKLGALGACQHWSSATMPLQKPLSHASHSRHATTAMKERSDIFLLQVERLPPSTSDGDNQTDCVLAASLIDGGLGGKHQPIKARSLLFAAHGKCFQGLGGKHQPIKARCLLFAVHGKCFQVSTAHKPAGASSFSFKVSTAYKQASTSSFFLKDYVCSQYKRVALQALTTSMSSLLCCRGKFKGHEVHHCHYSALLEYEEQQAGLRALPKLTRAHIFPNAFQKMSVRLTVQLFSKSTASAMEFYSKQEGCQKLHNSTATFDFTKQMNNLFDCLNSRRPQDVQYNEAGHIATLKANMKWLEDCCTNIESLPKQTQVFFLSKPTCGALRITLHSTVALIDRLLKSGFRYLLVGNLGQDPLECFFGIGRHVAGDGANQLFSSFCLYTGCCR